MTAAHERVQFRILYRGFLRRIVDLELLSAHGDVHKLLAQFGALLAAASFVLALAQIDLAYVPREQLATAAWSDEEVLISTTMAVVGMFAVLAWDSVFPDKRDFLILGMLPLRRITILRAKSAAIATGLGVSVASVNIFTSLVFAAAAHSGNSFIAGAMRTLVAYWVTMAAAGLFVFCALLGIQGLSAQVFHYRMQARISNVLQIAAFFLVLGVYFLTPGSDDFSITDPSYEWLVRALPSFWFVGLFQILHGAALPIAGMLAQRAVWALGIAAGVAAITYTLAYGRNMKRLIEQPDIMPSDRSRQPGRWIELLIQKLVPKPLERAVLLFAARTLARSRQHRLVLAAYMGLGLAISLAFARALLFGGARMYAVARSYGFSPPAWNEPNAALMTATFVMLFFGAVGTRAVFSLPAALKANWIFRIASIHSPKAYFLAVRKTLYGLAVWPMVLAISAVFLAIWPRIPAFLHVFVIVLAAISIGERALIGFRKIPFTCSYLPGQANLKLKLGAYGAAFFFAASVAGTAEYSLLQTTARGVALFGVLTVLAIQSRRRWAAFAANPYQRIEFEAVESKEVSPLDLSESGTYSRLERYVDVIDAPPEPTIGQRARMAAYKTAAVGGTFVLAGFVYDQVSEWLHPLPPRMGQRVYIGGRSLNIFCSGAGSPAVIFESGLGGPGLVWDSIQREIAKNTRACWYDRAGYGWSDPGPYPRDSAAIAEDLHRLLRQTDVAPPYVLVGASFGGLNIRVYNKRYAGDVAAMVLVDSSHIDNDQPIRPPGEGWLPYFPRATSVLAQGLKYAGVLRLIMDRRDASFTQAFEPRTAAESAKELFYESLLEARAAGGLGDKPLVVLTAGLPPLRPVDSTQARQLISAQQRWVQIQAQLAGLSTRGKQVVLSDSRHDIPHDRPDAVIDAVREVLADVRPSYR
jgi:pimeloyl-ACP methyl ester carboxylesterase